MEIHTGLRSDLDDSDIDSAELAIVLGIRLCFEGDLLAFLQFLEAITQDRGEVDEDIAAAVIVGDEAVALFRVEPFDSTVQHSENLPFLILPREMERSHE